MEAETNEFTTELDIKLFTPHPNFDDAINRAICQSEIEGGVALDALPPGTVLQVQTRNHLYRVENRGDDLGPSRVLSGARARPFARLHLGNPHDPD